VYGRCGSGSVGQTFRDHDRPLVGDGDEHDRRPQRHHRAPLKSVYNATKKLGWIDGRLSIGASDGRTHAHVSGVNTDGKLDAWLRGHAGRQDGALFGSLSFSKTGGLTGGAIGSGTGANAASATSISVKPKDCSASQVCAVSDRDGLQPDLRRLGADEGTEEVAVSWRETAGGASGRPLLF
jgi:hypothetical protein